MKDTLPPYDQGEGEGQGQASDLNVSPEPTGDTPDLDSTQEPKVDIQQVLADASVSVPPPLPVPVPHTLDAAEAARVANLTVVDTTDPTGEIGQEVVTALDGSAMNSLSENQINQMVQAAEGIAQDLAKQTTESIVDISPGLVQNVHVGDGADTAVDAPVATGEVQTVDLDAKMEDMKPKEEDVDMEIDGKAADKKTSEKIRNNRIDKWCEKYEELRAFKLVHEHTNVPRRSKRNPENDALGEWVHFQRRQYRNFMSGKTSTMTVVRKKALEQLGFQWARTGVLAKKIESTPLDNGMDAMTMFGKDLSWETRFNQLHDYIGRFGHMNVEPGWVENPTLGLWIAQQREENLKPWKTEDSEQKLKDDQEKSMETSENEPTSEEKVNETSSPEENAATQGASVHMPDIGGSLLTSNQRNASAPDDHSMTQERYNMLVSIDFKFQPSSDKDANDKDVEMEDASKPKDSIPDSERVIVDDPEDTMLVVIGEEDEISAMPTSDTKGLELNEPDATTLLDEKADSQSNDQPNTTNNAVADVHAQEESDTKENDPKQPETDEAPKDSTTEVRDVNATLKEDSTEVKDGEEAAIVATVEDQTQSGQDKDVLADSILDESKMDVDESQTIERKMVMLQEHYKNQGGNGNKPRLSLEEGYSRALQRMQVKEDAKKRRQTMIVHVAWEERFLELVQFRLRKDTCNIPQKWKPNPSLADWVRRQRSNYILYKKNEPCTLNTYRVAKLNSIGFEFHDAGDQVMEDVDYRSEVAVGASEDNVKKIPMKKRIMKPSSKNRYKEGKWLQSLAKVAAYKEVNGNCNVPRKWKDDPTLGEWVHFQRRQYRNRVLGKRNHMTDERIARLEEIGFEWSRGHSSNPPTYLRGYNQNELDMPTEQMVAEDGVNMSVDMAV